MRFRLVANSRLAVALLLGTLLLGGCGGGQKSLEPAASNSTEQASSSSDQSADPSDDSIPGTSYQVVPGESYASYAVKEIFLKENLNVTAIGKTTALSGHLKLGENGLVPSKVTADLRELKSDKERRDKALQTRGLEIEKFPTAEFQVTGPEGEAPAIEEGKEVQFKLAGQMAIHGVEKPLTFDAKAVLEGDTLKLTATTEFDMRDFDIEPPNVLSLISVDDHVKLEVHITARMPK